MMKKQLKWACPLLFLAALTPFTPWLDMRVATHFYNGQNFSTHPYFSFLFKVGELFGFFFGAVVLCFYLLSWVSKRYRRYREGALMIGLTLLIGAGIITNALFKEYWGRPRPKQIVEFGGTLDYRPFWKPNLNADREPQKSFPSGHVAMGFFYLSIIVVASHYRNRLLFVMGLFLTLFWGIGLMIARVAQGGHFVSDVIFSPVIMWLTVLILAKLTLKEETDARNN